MKKADVILHPVRLKIIQQFLGGEERTAKEIAQILTEVPQATLYRHLDTLVKKNILRITEEHQIRGTVEKVYALNDSETTVTEKDLRNTTKEEHFQYFLFFVTRLLHDYESYLQAEDVDLERDGIGYRQDAFYLSDTELQQMIRELSNVVKKYMEHKPASNRTKRLLSVIVMPDKGSKKDGS